MEEIEEGEEMKLMWVGKENEWRRIEWREVVMEGDGGGVNVSEKVWNRRRDLIWRMVNLCYVRIFLDEDEGNPQQQGCPFKNRRKGWKNPDV